MICHRLVHQLLEPLRFENYDRMKFIYDSFLEQIEGECTNGNGVCPGFWIVDKVWHAFQGYFQQRKQRGDNCKSHKLRLISALGRNTNMKDLKRKYRNLRMQPGFWINPWSIYDPPFKPPTTEASTQVEDSDCQFTLMESPSSLGSPVTHNRWPPPLWPTFVLRYPLEPMI